MGFVERTVWRLFNTPPKDPFFDEPSNILTTPSQVSMLSFELPSGSSSSPSSSTSSLSSSSTFWISPGPSPWSFRRYIPLTIRRSVSKKQIAVIACIIIALGFWVAPPPATWKSDIVHVTVQQPLSNPYHILRPVSHTKSAKSTPDPIRWLQRNSNNRYAEGSATNLWSSIPVLGQKNRKPRAALISLVRNSELEGLMQSMRQLEFQWNRKYSYPWIFFNDEPFSDDFKVPSPNEN